MTHMSFWLRTVCGVWKGVQWSGSCHLHLELISSHGSSVKAYHRIYLANLGLIPLGTSWSDQEVPVFDFRGRRHVWALGSVCGFYIVACFLFLLFLSVQLLSFFILYTLCHSGPQFLCLCSWKSLELPILSWHTPFLWMIILSLQNTSDKKSR